MPTREQIRNQQKALNLLVEEEDRRDRAEGYLKLEKSFLAVVVKYIYDNDGYKSTEQCDIINLELNSECARMLLEIARKARDEKLCSLKKEAGLIE